MIDATVRTVTFLSEPCWLSMDMSLAHGNKIKNLLFVGRILGNKLS